MAGDQRERTDPHDGGPRVAIHDARPLAAQPAKRCCAAENLTTVKLKDVSFELRRGEVLGIAGLVGSGRSELGAALFGVDAITSGTLRVHGESRCLRSPRHAMASGIGLLPEDRRLQGLMMRMSVLRECHLAVLPRNSAALGSFAARQEQARLAPVRAAAGAELPLDRRRRSAS